MRTTVRLDDELLAAAKAHAAKTGRSLTALFEDALRTFLALEEKTARRRPRNLPTCGSGGVHPGVDLADNAGLADIMDGFDAAD